MFSDQFVIFFFVWSSLRWCFDVWSDLHCIQFPSTSSKNILSSLFSLHFICYSNSMTTNQFSLCAFLSICFHLDVIICSSSLMKHYVKLSEMASNSKYIRSLFLLSHLFCQSRLQFDKFSLHGFLFWFCFIMLYAC